MNRKNIIFLLLLCSITILTLGERSNWWASAISVVYLVSITVYARLLQYSRMRLKRQFGKPLMFVEDIAIVINPHSVYRVCYSETDGDWRDIVIREDRKQAEHSRFISVHHKTLCVENTDSVKVGDRYHVRIKHNQLCFTHILE